MTVEGFINELKRRLEAARVEKEYWRLQYDKNDYGYDHVDRCYTHYAGKVGDLRDIIDLAERNLL